MAFHNSTAVHPLILHHPNRPRWTRTIQWCRGLFWTNPKSGIPELNSCTSTYLPSPKPIKMKQEPYNDAEGYFGQILKVAFQKSTAVHPLNSHHPNRPRWTRTIQWCGGLFWTNPKVTFQNSTAVHPLISHHPNRPRWTRTIQWCGGLFWTNPKSGIPEINSCTSTYLPSPKPTKMNKNHTMMRRAILDKS